MSEVTPEVKVEVKPEVKGVDVEPSPTEQAAMDQGWVPQEEWEASGRNPAEWRAAKEFVERGDLYKTIHSLKRSERQTAARLDVLQKHHQYVFEKAHKTALEELKREKRLAIRDDNHEAAETISEEMDALKESHEQERQAVAREVQQSQAAAPNPEFIEWVNKNEWYNSDTDLREFADATALVYMNKTPNATPTTVLKHVEGALKKHFPDKFGGKRAAPNAVAGVDRSSRVGNATKDVELDEFETEICRQLVAGGEMTEKEYKAELKKAKGIQ